MLEAKARELLEGPNYATITTLMPDGYPQTHIVWVGTDGEHVLVNTERHRQKARNAERNPKVTVTVWDRNDMWSWVEIRGDVVEVVGGPEARAHIDELSRKYLGHDYQNPVQTERVILKIAPRRQLVR
ncbi:MAG TPA: PPOX class F420-dependent oxidoreductase [Acidimicrobiia bacterium]|jgi:PPOX class probable F420-dependent enzyme|nr:PPOX class F420-dependent oxidoreductase [Acidimicrobiia bacterium]